MEKPILYQRKPNEEDVVNEIMKLAAYNGIILTRIKERMPSLKKVDGKWYKDKWTCRPSEAGIPDLIGYITVEGLEKAGVCSRYPVPIYIETKRLKGGRRRPAQEAYINRAKSEYVPAMFARSWDEVVAGIREWATKLGVAFKPEYGKVRYG